MRVRCYLVAIGTGTLLTASLGVISNANAQELSLSTNVPHLSKNPKLEMKMALNSENNVNKAVDVDNQPSEAINSDVNAPQLIKQPKFDTYGKIPHENAQNADLEQVLAENTESKPQSQVNEQSQDNKPQEQVTEQEQGTIAPKSPKMPEFQRNPNGILDPSPAATTDIEPLQPSANPLLFPTEKQEVTINGLTPITIDQAIELARRNNKDLQIAKLNLERSYDGLKEALAAQYPTLAAQIDLIRNDSAQAELTLAGSPFATNQDTVSTDLDTTFELNYRLYTGGRRSAQIQAAKSQVDFNKLEVERVSEQTRLDAVTSYYTLQSADAQVNIEQASVENSTQSLRDAELLEKAGLGTKFDVLQAQVELSNAQQRLRRANADQSTARRDLVKVLGLGQKVELTAADEIAIAGNWELSLEETIVQAYKNRAELEQELVRKDVSEEQRKIELSTIRPQVSLFGTYELLQPLDEEADVADGLAVGARMRWDFFDGGAARARAAQAVKDGEIAEVNFAKQRNDIRLEVERAYFDLEANRDNIDTAKIGVQLAEESLRLARLRFNAGVGTQTDVISSQTDLTTARFNLLRAVIGYNLSLARLQRQVSNLPNNQLFDVP